VNRINVSPIAKTAILRRVGQPDDHEMRQPRSPSAFVQALALADGAPAAFVDASLPTMFSEPMRARVCSPPAQTSPATTCGSCSRRSDSGMPRR
jgi:hypothetical protein